MPQQISHEERMRIHAQYLDAVKNNDWDKAGRISRKLPMAPEVAMAIKEAMGADYLKKAGFDLFQAEEAYGRDWLDR